MGILRHGLLQVCYAKAPKMFRIHLNVLGGRYMSGYGVYASGLGGGYGFRGHAVIFAGTPIKDFHGTVCFRAYKKS